MTQNPINDYLLDLTKQVAEQQQQILSSTGDPLEFLSSKTSQIDANDHDHDEDDLDKSAVTIAKATAMIVLFCASTLCGSIPFILNRWLKWTENNTNARSAIIVKCLLYFGGGVLLSTTFLHLLPEVSENIQSLQHDEKLQIFKFHLPELLMCLGFFAMFFVEEIIHSYLHRHQRQLNQIESASLAFERGHSVRDSFLVKGRRKSINSIKSDNLVIESSKTSGLSIQDLVKNDLENQKYEAQESASDIKDTGNHIHHIHHHHDLKQNNDQKLSPHHDHIYHSHPHHHHPHHHHHHHHLHHDHHGHGHSHFPMNTDVNEDMIVSSLRGLLIVLALSLHELFEGLAVGLEASANNVWYMFGAVSAHKLVLAFCVGVELIVARTRLWLAIIYVIVFAIVSPIGIGIGILISNKENDASAIPSALLQGLATGTLLYVVFFEILSKERSGLIAYLAFIIGFFCMFGLQFATGHEHTHSHGGHHDEGHSHPHSHGGHNDQHDHDEDHSTKSTEEQLKILKEAAGQFTTALAQTFNKN